MRNAYGVLNNREKIYFIFFKSVCGLIIFGTVIWNLSELLQISVINDEFGYWGIAAYFSGYDWTGLSGTSPYYGYGVGMIYFLLFKIFKDSVMMYKAAIVLNAVMLVTAFYISLVCAKKLFPHASEYLRILFCFFISFYPNTLVQSQYAWTETILYIWFWGMFLLVILIGESASYQKMLFFALGLVYGLMVHQRTLGIFCAGILVIFILMILGKCNKKQFFFFMITIILGFLVYLSIKKYLNDNFWKTISYEMASRNNFSGQLSIIQRIFTPEGIKDFVLGVFGKSFYLIISTVCIILPFLFYSFNLGIRFIKKYVLNKNESIPDSIWATLFLLLGFGATFLISAISMFYIGTRADNYFYGRYTEFLIGPILMVGIFILYQTKEKWTLFGISIGIITIISYVVNYVLNTNEFTKFYITNCAGIGNYFSDLSYIDNATYALLIKVIIIFFIVIVLFNDWKYKKCAYFLSGCIIVLGMWYPAIEYNNQNTYLLQEKFSENTKDVAETIRANISNDKKIYYVVDDSTQESFETDAYERNIKYIQFYLFDRKIEIKNYTELTDEKVVYIVRRKSVISEEMKIKFDLIYENELYYVLK